MPSMSQLIPVTTCIIIIATIGVLIISILSTFCYLYYRMSPKNIYYVDENGKNRNLLRFCHEDEDVG